MIDYNIFKWRCSSCQVYFKNLPSGILKGAIYIENEYHPQMNKYLRRWEWWLRRWVFDTYKCGNVDFTCLPSISKTEQDRLLFYHFPTLPKELSRKIPGLKTRDLLDYLEDPDDARFLKPGFLFYHREREDGITIYDYYPLVGLDGKAFSYREQIVEILKEHKKKVEEEKYAGVSRGIGHAGVACTRYEQNENYADNRFESFDVQTQSQIALFKKQVEELQKRGVPIELLEKILHQDEQLSKLVITKKYEILLPDYDNMVIKMEPLVKAIFFLFLKHPEGIVFKHLPDYRQELIDIYKNLRPYGLNERSLQSIEDVTNPLLNSINEKCARIRAAFVDKFNDRLAKNYYISGTRAGVKKIMLSRDLVVWE